ncbi:hypothetical protein Q1W73_09500 [Asticcacaulis sp. ZE23SCel15]|uniref:hypothetical protein n=1 Tax=Asticcacaulis sp. ZE23SCel15 TaxID=3059027 RepID=UPI00265E9F28|nr:hypothetical protein [Asticcacaulis sp. ZE23SCel15]WKL55939.1 hypothetical protein Q1W73_09500 [Asticcacaulis sp. ZE23SCel15]
MNRAFNALLVAYAVAYFGNILVVLLFSQHFPVGAGGAYDQALSEVFAAYGDRYSSIYSGLYWGLYYLNMCSLVAALILLAVRKTPGIEILMTFMIVDVILFYFISSNSVTVSHKILTVSGLVTYPLQGAIIALYFSGREKLGFGKVPQLEPIK